MVEPITKPAAAEHSPHQTSYIALVPDGDVRELLARQIVDTLAELRKISEADSLKRYAPGKWSLREVVGHMIDTERIFASRALRIARGDRTPLPGFEQDDYVAAAHFDERPWAELLAEFDLVRQSTLFMIRGFNADDWTRVGTVSGNTLTVRAAAFVIAGHERHHMKLVREKYLA
jgi:uncharacterized damage-inducible protein DinB